MIEADLTHRLFLKRVTRGETRDAYGQRQTTTQEVEYPCFYSGTMRRLRDGNTGQDIVVTARVLLGVDSEIKNADQFVKVTDAHGNVIDDSNLKIVAVKRPADDEGVHHQEVLLSKYGSS